MSKARQQTQKRRGGPCSQVRNHTGRNCRAGPLRLSSKVVKPRWESGLVVSGADCGEFRFRMEEHGRPRPRRGWVVETSEHEDYRLAAVNRSIHQPIRAAAPTRTGQYSPGRYVLPTASNADGGDSSKILCPLLLGTPDGGSGRKKDIAIAGERWSSFGHREASWVVV